MRAYLEGLTRAVARRATLLLDSRSGRHGPKRSLVIAAGSTIACRCNAATSRTSTYGEYTFGQPDRAPLSSWRMIPIECEVSGPRTGPSTATGLITLSSSGRALLDRAHGHLGCTLRIAPDGGSPFTRAVRLAEGGARDRKKG